MYRNFGEHLWRSMINTVRKSVNMPPNCSVLNVNRLLTNWILHPRFSFAHMLGRAAGSPARWSLGTALHCGTSGGLSWRDCIQGQDQTYTVPLTTWHALRNTQAQLFQSFILTVFLGIHADKRFALPSALVVCFLAFSELQNETKTKTKHDSCKFHGPSSTITWCKYDIQGGEALDLSVDWWASVNADFRQHKLNEKTHMSGSMYANATLFADWKLTLFLEDCHLPAPLPPQPNPLSPNFFCASSWKLSSAWSHLRPRWAPLRLPRS